MIRKYVEVKTIIRFILIVLVSIFAIITANIPTTKDKPCNYVELQATYKNYIVVNKKCKNNVYTLTLMNPIIEQNAVHKHITTTNIKVTESIYYNIYHVGDTIK